MITEIHRSPYTKLHPLALGNCRWTSGFWSDKFSVCQESMVPYMGKLLCGDIGHALNNFKIAAGLLQGEHQGMYWHDGDFYKWLEAVMYTAVYAQDEMLIAQIDEYIDVIAQAQQSNGYLQTQVQLNPEIEPYTNRKYHEMYNTGHLFIAACLHFRATGKRKFLEVAIKQADLLYEIFFPENEKYGRFGFNQTQIMGLVELYRCTGTRHYLELAERFVNRRGTYPVEHDSSTEGYPIGDMVQERTPLRQESEAVGHAVLALYYYAGAADIYAETGEETLRQALVRLWQNITEKKMYLTGAVGQTHYGASTNRDKIEEGFIDDYMLPNLTAYNETCANICNAIFSRRMLQLEGESKYADIIELVLYNSALSGIDIEGERYFYANPLRMIHGARSYGDHENATETANRESYLECFCCPPNLVRTIAQVSGWAYSLTDHGIAVNLFGSNYLSTKLLSGSKLELTQTSEYPWQGRVDFVVEACPTSAMEILLRIPSWADDTHIFINDAEVEEEITAGKYFKNNPKMGGRRYHSHGHTHGDTNHRGASAC